MKGIFGSLFDLNKDGKMDPEEMALEFAILDELLEEDNDNDEYDGDDEEDW